MHIVYDRKAQERLEMVREDIGSGEYERALGSFYDLQEYVEAGFAEAPEGYDELRRELYGGLMRQEIRRARNAIMEEDGAAAEYSLGLITEYSAEGNVAIPPEVDGLRKQAEKL